MNANVYEFVAQAMRYVFALLMVVIAVRAWRITVIDSRRATKLRRLSPETGLSGELVVLEGDERAKRGMRYPVIREGMIGTSRRADVRIRHSSVRRRHAYFQITDKGLMLRGHANARLINKFGHNVRTLLMQDGDQVRIGKVLLLLVLSEATNAQEVHHLPRKKRPREEERSFEPGINGAFDDELTPPVDLDDIFDIQDDEETEGWFDA